MDDQEIIRNELEKTLSVRLPPYVSDEALLQQLAIIVSDLLQKNADSFFQLMYRLDISEIKLREALEDKIHAVDKLAVLIYERQVEKIRSRRQSFKDDVQDDELSW